MSGRIRSLKPELTRCRELADVPETARYTFLLLLTMVDDEGRAVDDPRLIKADCHPLDDITTAEVEERLACLANERILLCRYTVDERRFLHVPRFRDDGLRPNERSPWGQHPQKAQPSRYPPCPHDHESPGQATLWAENELTGQAVREHSRNGTDALKEVPAPRDQVPRTKDQGPSTTRVARTMLTGQALDAAFDAFWAIYPRKHEKQRARAAFTKALSRAHLAAILWGAEGYRDDPGRVDAYTKHASTWLNNACWDDPPLPSRGRVAQHDAEVRGAAGQAAAMRRAERSAAR